ncbi:MAG: hypothetical protein DRN83_03095 [Hadesarchaea archaeon]|nr:MAG: hypothetical protein DRN83_03095 [Hadesarchaea archaeon]
MAEKTLKPLPERFPVPSDVRSALERIVRPRKKNFYERFCSAGARVFGRFTKNTKLSVQTLKDLRDAKLAIEPSEWAAGMLFSVFIPATFAALLWLLLVLAGGDPFFLLYLPLLGALLSALSLMAFQAYPSSLAASRKTDAQSQAITTIMLLSFSLYHRPDLRGATIQAADSSEGKLAEDLQKGLLDLDERRRYETVRHLLTVVANEWGEIDDSTRQAIFDLLRSTGVKEETIRLSDVAKAPERVLEGADEQLTRRLNSLMMPTLAFLTFSSLAIIGVVGLSPVFGVIGMQFVDLRFFVMIAVSLVVGFLTFTLYMEKRRPITIQVLEIPPDDPRLPPPGKARFGGKLVPAWLPSLVVFAALAWPGVLYLLGFTEGPLGMVAMSFTTLWFVWATAGAVAVYGYLYTSKRAKLREEERRKLTDWGNALNTIGSRMIDGKPAPQAMEETAELMEGSPLAEQLKRTSAVMKRYGVDMHEALFGRRAEKRVHNTLIRSFLGTISRIRRDSEVAAGHACMMAAEFLRTLHRVERRFRERIDEAMGNLWLVAVVLIPVVCAMSVWVMDFMSGMKFTIAAQTAVAGVTGMPFLLGTMEANELAILRLVMGLTAVVLGGIVARYIATIRAGRDKVELWSAISKSTVTSAIIFTVTSFLLTMITVGGI